MKYMIETTHNMLMLSLGLLLFACEKIAESPGIEIETDPESGGITHIGIAGDTTEMNWIVSPDNSQYEWIGPEYAWGLGCIRINGNAPIAWNNADTIRENTAVYHIGKGVELSVSRKAGREKGIMETFCFKNTSSEKIALSEIEINTPFNDNYPDAETCISKRCHAHIWAGGNAAYVYALRMGGESPHLGLMLTEGSIDGYVIKERAKEKGLSNTRGIICLCPEDCTLSPGEEYTISWLLFSHDGKEEFYNKMKKTGGVVATANKYAGEVGDTVLLRVTGIDKSYKKEGEKLGFYLGDTPLKTTLSNDTLVTTYLIDRTGDINITCHYAKGKKTHVELWGVSNIEELIDRRVRFIMKHQQYHALNDPRDGALLPYDNETESMITNWNSKQRRSDLNEGRERVGMGILLALQSQEKEKDEELREALIKYTHFVRTALQDPNYRTWSELDRTKKHRIYNYPWITNLYLETFLATEDKQYLIDAYETQMAAYRYGGYDFYSIDVPIMQSISLLRKHNMEDEAEKLLGEYRKVADIYIEKGVNYPKSEVNYEQSIVVPSVNFICQMYLITHEEKYLEAARKLMPVVEAFGGMQPSYHLHDIAIRHWDGYWFGKRQMWGDTMPHYWSCITADCFAYYSHCTGDQSYMERAKAILRGNLCLFTEDGRAGCAWLYPTRVNGETGRFLEPLANDQDFALMYYIRWHRLLHMQSNTENL